LSSDHRLHHLQRRLSIVLAGDAAAAVDNDSSSAAGEHRQLASVAAEGDDEHHFAVKQQRQVYVHCTIYHFVHPSDRLWRPWVPVRGSGFPAGVDVSVSDGMQNVAVAEQYRACCLSYW